MSPPSTTSCKGHPICKRDVHQGKGHYCKFHLPALHPDAMSPEDFDQSLIQEIIDTEEEDGKYVLHWEGFSFPNDHILFGHKDYEKVTDRLAKSWISIKDSDIQNIHIPTLEIHALLLNNSTIHGNMSIGVANINRINIENAIFKGKFHCASKTQQFEAQNSSFENDFSFSAIISEYARFSSGRFHGATHFHNRDRERMLFDNKEMRFVNFDNVIFWRPSQTFFRNVNLQKASFKSVGLVGVNFTNTDFYQKELCRNGIHNEIREVRRKASFITQLLHLIQFKSTTKKSDNKTLTSCRYLISEYRELRMAMENNKDYIKAQDFYVGEMENRLERENSWILRLYQICSIFGSSYKRALLFLGVLVISHLILTVIFSTNLQIQNLYTGPETVNTWQRIGDVIIHTLSTGTLQKTGILNETSNWQKLIDIFFRLMIPLQAAMFILAVRNKTKR